MRRYKKSAFRTPHKSKLENPLPLFGEGLASESCSRDDASTIWVSLPLQSANTLEASEYHAYSRLDLVG